MPEQDKWSQYEVGGGVAETATSTSAPTEPAPSSTDKWAQYEVGSAPEAKSPETAPTFSASTDIGSDKWAKYEVGAPQKSSSQSELNRSEVNPQLQGNSEAPDPNAPWYKKLWEDVNAPLFDEKTAKNWFDWDVDHWNGWGKGLFDLASGLTSPLSIALAVGSFGSSSLFEAGGMTALKAGGMAADEIAQVVKGSDILAKAIKMGHDPEMAWGVMEKFGADPNIVKQGLGLLEKAGMKGESLIANGIVRRTGTAMLSQFGADIGTADKVSHFAQVGMDAGFTAQNLYAAAVASPRVLDAIKEGDFDTAKRLAIDAIGSAGFAYLGGKSIHQHAGDLMTDAEAAAGLHVKPSDENLKVRKLLEPRERERIIAGEREQQWEQAARKEFNIKSDKKWIAGGSSESDLRARFYRESEGREDVSNMAAWHDAIAEAAGRTKDKISSDSDWPPEIKDALESAKIKDKPSGYIDQLLKASDPRLLTENEIKYAKHTGEHFDENGEKAIGEETLKDLFDSYVTRAWKDPENDTIKKFRTVSSTSGFSVDTAMARKRVFNTTLEGLLKGHELENHDMIALAAHNGNEFSRVASDRGFLRRLRGAGARGSDGRPVTALSGSGEVVESFDKDGNVVNPATMINPKGMQGVRMSDKQVEGLRKNVLKPGVKASINSSHIETDPIVSLGEKSEGMMGTLRPLIRDGKQIGDLDHTIQGDTLIIHQLKTEAGVKAVMDKVLGNDVDTSEQLSAREYGDLARQVQKEHPEVKYFEAKRVGGIRGDEGRSVKIPIERLLRNSGATVTEGKPAFTDLDRMIKEGRIVRFGVDRNGKEMFAWTTHDYKTIDHSSFRGWKMPTMDTQGNPVFVNGEMRVHPEAYEYLNRLFGGEESVVQKLPGAKTALTLAREAKGLLLAFSPFHFAQEGLRAIMTGISPIGSERFNPQNPMHVLAAEKGVWEFKDYKGVKAFEDGLVGHSKIISKVPVLREIQSWTQSMLFDRYIPGLKLRAFERMMDANERAHPQWTKEQRANESAQEVNERFGGLDYKRMGRSLATMDVARLTTLAPDWLESELRFMKRTFGGGDEGTVARRDMLKMTAGLFVTARVLNYLISGKAHNEAPFGVAYTDDEGREKVYSIRSMPTDTLHMLQDPAGFLNGRVSPLLKTGIQTYTGRDEFGRKMSTNGIFVNLLRNVAPISAQNIAKKVTGEDTGGLTNTDQIVKSAGGTVYPYRTEAQKLAAKVASDHAEGGAVDKDKLARHQYVIHLEDQVRSGKTPITDIFKAVEAGQLHVDEAKKIMKNAQETAGMEPEMARLYAHATRLPMGDLLKVWDSAGADEKAALSKLLIKRQIAYFKKSAKEMSASERSQDQVYLRLRKMFPQSQPF